MLNKLSKIVIIFLLIYSCEKENKLETKETLPQLKNFEIKKKTIRKKLGRLNKILYKIQRTIR